MQGLVRGFGEWAASGLEGVFHVEEDGKCPIDEDMMRAGGVIIATFVAVGVAACVLKKAICPSRVHIKKAGASKDERGTELQVVTKKRVQVSDAKQQEIITAYEEAKGLFLQLSAAVGVMAKLSFLEQQVGVNADPSLLINGFKKAEAMLWVSLDELKRIQKDSMEERLTKLFEETSFFTDARGEQAESAKNRYLSDLKGYRECLLRNMRTTDSQASLEEAESRILTAYREQKEELDMLLRNPNRSVNRTGNMAEVVYDPVVLNLARYNLTARMVLEAVCLHELYEIPLSPKMQVVYGQVIESLYVEQSAKELPVKLDQTWY